MADGLKLNLKEAILLKNAEGTWWELKGKDSSGASFSWQSPVVYTVDVSKQYDQKFEISVVGQGSGTHHIDWGDGNITSNSAGNGATSYSHTYSTSTGIFDVHITASVPFYVYDKQYNQAATAIKGYYGSGTTSISRSQSNSLTSAPEVLPPKITSLAYAFQDAGNFNSAAVTGWDTSRVVSMRTTFDGASYFNQDISSWDTSKVTTMSSMFSDAGQFNQDISGWDVSSVIRMSSMFNNANSFNQNISGWDVSNVTDMSYMFYGADIFNQDISSWDTSKVTTMRNMFQATAMNRDLGSLDISSCTTMVSMFSFSAMSTENYSRTLIGFANAHYAGNALDNVPFGGTNMTYNNTAYTTGNQFNDAVSARAYLVGTAGWTITDGGQV